MNKSRLGIFSLLLCAFFIFGCSGGSNINTTPPQSALVSFTMTDTPPAGVTLLSFEVHLTGAALNPGNVDLLGKGPISIEVENLQTESAFLNTAQVASGTYTALNLTFANPEVTFKNDTGASLAGCAAGAVCEINPTGTLTSTFTFPGSGITIAANSPTAIQVDVNPDTILSAMMNVDFSQPGAVTAQQLNTKPEGELDDVDELRGSVQNLDTTNKTFTLHTMDGDFAITTDSNTQFEFESCATNDFFCLMKDQVVQVDVKVMAGGIFLARKIEFEDDAEDDELEGIVFKVDDAIHFEMVVLEELRSVNNIAVGNPVVVTLSNPSFQVKSEELMVPSGFAVAFEGTVDTSQLLTGQALEIRLTAPASAGQPISVTADRVRLRMTEFTASVSGTPASPNFTVGSLPALFTDAGINSIHVQTSSMTEFEGVTGVSGLADGNSVSLRGLLFKNAPNPPELIAQKVRKR
jgi:hypothetical protein